MSKFFFTPAGVEKQKQKIAELADKMDKLKVQLAEMADVCGDEWHDNFMFEQTIIQVADLEHFINEEREVLNQAIIVDPPTSNERVEIGHKIKVRIGEREVVYTIGGYGESDPSADVLAYDTPIGKVIIGMKVGEIREIEFGPKKTTVEILEIKTPPPVRV